MGGLIAGHGFIGYSVLNPSWVNMICSVMDLGLMVFGYFSFRWEVRELRVQAIRRRVLTNAGRLRDSFQDRQREFYDELDQLLR